MVNSQTTSLPIRPANGEFVEFQSCDGLPRPFTSQSDSDSGSNMDTPPGSDSEQDLPQGPELNDPYYYTSTYLFANSDEGQFFDQEFMDLADEIMERIGIPSLMDIVDFGCPTMFPCQCPTCSEFMYETLRLQEPIIPSPMQDAPGGYYYTEEMFKHLEYEPAGWHFAKEDQDSGEAKESWN